MTRSERIFLTQNWHIDCRLVAELPEDSVVGVRFITYVVSSAVAVVAVILTGYLAYTNINLRSQIDTFEQRIEEDKWEVIEIKRLQRFYEAETKKIESAYSEMKNPTSVSGFISALGRTLPERMVVDSIDWSDGKVVVRGGLRETSEHASMLLGDYLDKLRANPEVGPHFSSIVLSGAERSTEDEQTMVFEITFHLIPRNP
jgi:hypothetical protein